MRRLIVDGYNVIHAWPELKLALRRHGLEQARRRLVSRLGEYRAGTGAEVIVVFDSHNRPRGTGDIEVIDGVELRYGSSDESADHVIERLMHEATRRQLAGESVVATNDRLQRAMVSAMGVATMSAEALLQEIDRTTAERGSQIARRRSDADFANRLEHRLDPDMLRRLEEIRRGGGGGLTDPPAPLPGPEGTPADADDPVSP